MSASSNQGEIILVHGFDEASPYAHVRLTKT